MSVGNIPSGSGGFKLPGWGPFSTAVGGTVLGGGTLTYYYSSSRHQMLMREQNRGQLLKQQRLTPHQYTLYGAEDGRSAFEVKQGLLASGIKYKGLDFSNPDNFDVEEGELPDMNHIQKYSPFRKKSLRLKQYGEEKLLLGRRGGGSTPSAESEAEVEEVLLEEGPELEAEEYGYSPNMSYEVSEQTLQDPREVVYSFTAPRANTIPSIVFYIIAFLLTVGGGLLLDYVKGRFSKWTASEDSQESSSPLEEAVSVEEVKRLQGEEEGLDTDEGGKKGATPEFLLEALKSCKRKAITKKETVYLLVRYYGLSKEEASQLLS